MRTGLVLIVLLLVTSCAQVGVLEGGPSDDYAPVPNKEKMSPKDETTGFNGKEITIPYNEFIKLNSPNETLIVVPPTIKPRASIKGKSLVLKWDEELAPNTTYAFYLNGTVTDVTEGNDSLMTFVFSTGDFIDSLSYETIVVDAFGGQALANVTVGLYTQFSDTVLPTYFGRSDREGKIAIKYLKPGSYQVIAFEDKNKDLKPQKNELFGFQSERLILSDKTVDSTKIRLFKPKAESNIQSFEFNGPAAFKVGANTDLTQARFVLNGEQIDPKDLLYITNDSLLIRTNKVDTNRFQLIVEKDRFVDTVSLRITQKDREKSFVLTCLNGKEWLAKEALTFYSNANISDLDTSQIVIHSFDKGDTTAVSASILELKNGSITSSPNSGVSGPMEFMFLPGAIATPFSQNTDTIRYLINFLAKKDLGTAKVTTTGFEESHFIELYQGNTLVTRSSVMNNGSFLFENLKPNTYSFRVMLDTNKNGKWDVGVFTEKIQPEVIIVFPESKKVRANWDLDIELNYNGN